MIKRGKSNGLILEENGKEATWIPVRDAADLIHSTPTTIYNQIGKGVIRKLLVGKSVLLVSMEDAVKYGENKKTYFTRFTKATADN